MRYLFLFLLLPFSAISQNQNTLLEGRVLDPEFASRGLIGCVVKVTNEKSIVAGTVTDFEGYFSIRLDSGLYMVEFAYTGKKNKRLESIRVLPNQTNTLPDVTLEDGELLNEVVVTAYKVPLIQKDQIAAGQTLTSDQIRKLPTREMGKMAASTAGAYSTNNVNVKGSRSNATNYYVDGIRVSASTVQVQDNVKKNRKPFFSLKKSKVKTEPELDSEQYNTFVENEYIQAAAESVSTFSIDVDNAAYSNVRRFLNMHQLPPKDAVRIEEMVNYFEYGYKAPTNGDPFAVHTELAECPWNTQNRLLRIALKGQDIDLGQLPPSNLVFLIDVSGSMSAQNKLPLVKKSLAMLTDQLRPEDHVSIVVYAGAAGLVLPPTSGSDKTAIKTALENLKSGGSTAGGAGIQLAYATAQKHFQKNGNNRVILCTDGDFNVGISDEKGLEKLIEQERKSSIYLTVLGFGMGNYQDGKMQTLADKGNGNHAYIDTEKEAKKVLVKEFGGTLFAIAKDVKLQLDFNPEAVKRYRLIGYENRLLAKEDFDDDRKDAGELGVGHTVTALYEIEPKHNDRLYRDLFTLKLRYKNPKKGEDKTSQLIEHHLSEKPTDVPSSDFQLAASIAEFGLLLRDSKYKANASFDNVLTSVSALAKEENASEWVVELEGMVARAKELSKEAKP